MTPPDLTAYAAQVNQAAAFIRSRLSAVPDVAVQLGTGLGGLTEKITDTESISYSDIPFFPRATVASHAGNLIGGKLGGKRILVLAGRFHFYEGYSTREVTFPIRVLQVLGVKTLVITNASGGLNPLFVPGTIMVIRDHLNFLGENPLRGPNIEEWGPRFPDLSEPYDPGLAGIALSCSQNSKIRNVVTGTYVCIPGPSLETPAETRWLRDAGADAVGMSSVPEVIVAVHGGMKVLGLSVIANTNDPDNFQPILLDDIIKAAEEVKPRLEKLVAEITGRM